MIRIVLAGVAAVGLSFAADAETYPVHMHRHVHTHHRVGGGFHPVAGIYHGGAPGEVGPLCQDANGSLLVCSSRNGGALGEVGPLCQDANGSLLVCSSG